SGEALANLPADGRTVTIGAKAAQIVEENGRRMLVVNERVRIPLRMAIELPAVTTKDPNAVAYRLVGRWITENGDLILAVSGAGFGPGAMSAPAGPMRICMFFTDGYVGNDPEIIQAVRDNAGTTRVFSFGIGNSVNRSLLEQMALAGRGECEFVLL